MLGSRKSSRTIGGAMHPAEIQAALKLKGYSQADIANDCGVKPATVSMVINGKARSAQVEQRIADVTGYLRMNLWPQWYDDGAAPGKAWMELVGKDEKLLLRSYRALMPRERAIALAYVQALEAGNDPDPPPRGGGSVIAGGGSIAAGRDAHVGKPPRKRT